jgi:hypothetical protein
MSALWGVLATLAALIASLLLAGWLLGRDERRERRRQGPDSRGKMPR